MEWNEVHRKILSPYIVPQASYFPYKIGPLSEPPPQIPKSMPLPYHQGINYEPSSFIF
jgi:hypothetical protein